MAETRTYNGHTYSRSGPGQAWHLVGGGMPAGVSVRPTNPYAADQNRRAEQAAAQEQVLRSLQIKRQQRELDQEDVGAWAPASGGGPSGEEFLKTQPANVAAQVRALAEGRMAFPTGAAMRSPYWQRMLSQVAQYDPSFDAINFNSRNATRRDGAIGKTSDNIKSINTAIGHLGELYSQISGTASSGGYPFATTVNALRNAYNRGYGDPGPTKFEQTAGALASELTRVFRQAGGNEADIQRELQHLDPNASIAQKRAAVQNIVGLLKSRLDAIGDQYRKGMGTTADPLVLLDDKAKKVLAAIGSVPDDGAAPPAGNAPPGGPPPSGGAPGGPSLIQQVVNQQEAPGVKTVATGATRTEHNTAAEAAMNAMIRSGASAEQINAMLAQMGIDPLSKPEQVAQAQAFLRANPGYKGGFAEALRPVQQTMLERVAGSPAGAFVTGALNGATAGWGDEAYARAKSLVSGTPYEQELSTIDTAQHALAADYPKSTFVGNLVGAGGALAGATALLPEAAVAGGVFAPGALALDAGYGALAGAGDVPGNRLGGAVAGGLFGLGGGVVGRGAAIPLGAAARTAPGRAIVDTFGRVRGRAPEAVPNAPSPAERSIAAALDKAGPDAARATLAQADRLGLPMTLADTSPNLRELTGAAVRRSDTASGIAENALIPRGRGQIDRFGQAVERDLGRVGNLPQMSEALTQQARAASGPLYEQAYAAPGTSSDEIASLLATPFGKDALARARTIAANERRDPTSLGFDIDPLTNEVALTRAPSMQTLDYAKRGMDDVLEQYRDKNTGRMNLGEAGRVQLDVKNKLLAEMDRLNPAYAEARAAYAGPVQARDAMYRGYDALRERPDTLAQVVAGLSPEHLAQAQLGYRGAMMDAANNVRLQTNPYEAVLGTPAAEQRLAAMYPEGGDDIARLLTQRDMERQMAGTTNAILGNSRTAGRQIADAAFADDSIAQHLVDAGTNVALGQVPVGAAVRGLGAGGARLAARLRNTKQAVAKADDIARLLLDPAPTRGAAEIDRILNAVSNWQDYVAASRPTQFTGNLGRAGAEAW